MATVAVTGILATAFIFPNAMHQFGRMLNKRKKSDLKYYLNKRRKKLIHDGFLKIINKDGKEYVALTEEGEKRIEYFKNKEEKNVKWDGKWRVVVFDVWERTRKKRDALRWEIKNFGFVQLQRSVWVYPYNCAQFIELLKTNLSFGKNIRYMVVEKLDHDENLRKHFQL